MLKFLYKKFKKKFHDMMIEDLLLSIPDKVSKPGMEILASKKEIVTKWLYFEAHSIFRRPVIDFGGAERRNGMLIFIQALMLGLGEIRVEKQEHPIVGETVSRNDDFKNTIKNFKERKVIPRKV